MNHFSLISGEIKLHKTGGHNLRFKGVFNSAHWPLHEAIVGSRLKIFSLCFFFVASKAERNVLPVLNNLLENREMHLEDGRLLIPAQRYDRLLEEHTQEELDK